MALTNGTVTDSATPSEAVSTEQLFYQYSTIDKAKRAFRLIILRGGTGHDIDCKIVESTIDSNTLPYEAVSYTWGPSFTADTVNINGKKLPVTFNLSLILRDIRLADADRVIWVDAICIDQQDATEKGHQVGQMQDIFALAERVLFCIARPTNYTDLLMGSLERLQSGMQNIDLNDDSAIGACWSEIQTAIARHHLNSQPQPSIETLLSVQLEALTFLQRQGLEYILGQAWFHRVWILQEVANARDALIYCGQKSISAAVFVLGGRLLGFSLPSEQRKTVDEVLNLMPGLLRKDPSQNLLSLLHKFGMANATVERDRIYALFGICEDKQVQTHIPPDYVKPEQDVINETIAYICHCEVSIITTSPYDSIAHFLSDLDNFHNNLLSHFIRWKNIKGALHIMQRHGRYISVTPDMFSTAVNDTMMREGVMSQLLEQRNAATVLSGQCGWKPLLLAAEHGYDTLVKQMLEKGAFIEAHDSEEDNEERKDLTPLFLAAMNGHETVVKILLENGANLSSRGPRKGTPLAWAARNGHISVVQLLVRKGAVVGNDVVDNSDLETRTPLAWAASKGYEAIVRLLLKHGADPTRKEFPEDDTPLSRAAESGHMVTVQILLESCADIDALYTYSASCMEFALLCAARAGHAPVVGLLFDNGASNDLLDVLGVMVENSWKEDDRQEDFEAIVMTLFAKGAHFRESSNPLVKAAAAGNEGMVRLFLDNGAEVDYLGARHIDWAEREYSGTALAFAVRYGHKDVAELLLAEGADLEAQDSDGHTPLIVAARSGHENVVRLLLEKGADNRAKDCDGQPPFAGALLHWNIVKLLLEEGPDVAVRECNGGPLLCAAEVGREDIVNMLLARGAYINPRDDDLFTPLLHAADKGHVDVVDLLLENGAGIEVRGGKLYQTPLHLAAACGHVEIARALLENGADIEVRDSCNHTPLCLAACSGHENTIRVLLENGADIDSRGRYRGPTPLQLAAENGHKKVVKVLLENGADINVKDYRERMPWEDD